MCELLDGCQIWFICNYSVVEAAKRDLFVDFVRASSLVVVVIWHWAFTVFDWQADGPHATSPIGFTTGMWLLTWLLQVMPLFFFVGGWANISAWRQASAKGATMSQFISKRVKSLAVPALGLVGVWWLLTTIAVSIYDASWLWAVALLVVSPLWFAVAYLVIVCAMPLWLWLDNKFGVLVPVWLAGLAGLIDVARFNHGWGWAGWFNMLFVWGLAHQIGFHYDKLAKANRQHLWAMMWAGLFGLSALVWAGLYPGSMVGVPGDKFSNMAPPSLAIVALVFFQVGALMLLRPWFVRKLQQKSWKTFTAWLNTYSLPLYLLHSSGMVVAFVLFYFLTGKRADTLAISPLWWATRPLAILVPFLTTLPLLYVYGKVSKAKRPQRKDT